MSFFSSNIYSTSKSSNLFSGLETMFPVVDGGGGVSVPVFEVGEMMFWVVGGMV